MRSLFRLLGLSEPERTESRDTETVRRLLDPEEFIKTHTHVGGTAPSETRRLLDARQCWIADARQRQDERKTRIADGDALLAKEVSAICGA